MFSEALISAWHYFSPFEFSSFILIIFCVCCAPVWQRGRVLAVGWTFQKRSHPVNPQSIGIGTSHTHTPLHLPSGHSSVLSSFLPSIYPSIHPSTRCPLQSDLAQTNQHYTRGRDCVNQIKRAPFTPPGKKKVLKFLILTKIPQWKQILFIPCPRRSTAKWNRETT